MLAALGCATALTFLARGQGLTAVVLYTSLGGTNFGAVTSQLNKPRQLQMGLKFNY